MSSFSTFTEKSSRTSTRPVDEFVSETEFDISKLTFSAPVENERGGKSIDVLYNGGFACIRGPMDQQRVPFSVKLYEDSGRKKFSFSTSVTKDSVFAQHILAIDEQIKRHCKENSLAWLGKKSVSDTQINIYFSPSLKLHMENGEPSGRYDPTMNVKLPTYPDGKKNFLLYDKDRNAMPQGYDIISAIPAGSNFEGIYRLKSIWVVDSNFGALYELVQGQVFPAMKINSFLLNATSNRDIGKETVVTPSGFNSSLFSFGTPIDHERGGKVVPIQYNGKTLVLTTSERMRVPFGPSCFVEKDNKKYTVAVSLLQDEFLQTLRFIDNAVEAAVLQKPLAWGMKKKELSKEEFLCFYRPSVKMHKKDGEVTNLFPPTLNVKIPFYEDSRSQFMLFDANKELVQSDKEITDLIPKNSEMTALVRVKNVYVTAKTISVSFELVQAQLFVQKESSISSQYALGKRSAAQDDILAEVKQEVDDLIAASPLQRTMSTIAPVRTGGHSVDVEDSDEEIAVEE